MSSNGCLLKNPMSDFTNSPILYIIAYIGNERTYNFIIFLHSKLKHSHGELNIDVSSNMSITHFPRQQNTTTGPVGCTIDGSILPGRSLLKGSACEARIALFRKKLFPNIVDYGTDGASISEFVLFVCRGCSHD